jgi:hypothetical protein
MLQWIPGIIDRLCAAVGAIAAVQAPLFMQQYVQQLVGRQAELQLQVEAMRRNAALSGKSLEQLIQKFISSGDMDVVRQGEVLSAIVDRWHHLSDALVAMQGSTIWTQPFIFLYHLNADVFSSTWHRFHMGLPLTLEGGVYALVGVGCGYAVFALFKKVVSLFLKSSYTLPLTRRRGE